MLEQIMAANDFDYLGRGLSGEPAAGGYRE